MVSETLTRSYLMGGVGNVNNSAKSGFRVGRGPIQPDSEIQILYNIRIPSFSGAYAFAYSYRGYAQSACDKQHAINNKKKKNKKNINRILLQTEVVEFLFIYSECWRRLISINEMLFYRLADSLQENNFLSAS